jgi:hypothetical protein
MTSLEEELETYERYCKETEQLLDFADNLEKILHYGGGKVAIATKKAGLFSQEEIRLLRELCYRQLEVYHILIQDIKDQIIEKQVAKYGKQGLNN